MAIKAKTAEEIEIIRQSCKRLSETLAQVAIWLKAGITGLELDKMAEDYIRSFGGSPSFKGFEGFPASLCISVNDEVVHGIPTDRPFKDGDVVSIDCGVFLGGYHGDMAYTFGIGKVSAEAQQLMKVTKESLALGIAQAITGNRTGDVGFAIEDYCQRKHGYGIVRELVGHGLGKTLHEDPQIPNYGKRGNGAVFIENCVVAIEPMINLGKRNVYTKKDNWTIATQDGKPSAHFEHTLVVKTGKPELLTDFTGIEKGVEGNADLVKI